MAEQTTLAADMGVRRFGRVNWRGLMTLIHREGNRFWAVKGQTVMAPLVTGALFLFIFMALNVESFTMQIISRF